MLAIARQLSESCIPPLDSNCVGNYYYASFGCGIKVVVPDLVI
jgi:hypothetical protein